MVDEDPPSSYQSLSEMIEHMRSKNEAEVRIMAENIYAKIELENWVGEAIGRGDDFAIIPMQHFEIRGEDHFINPADWVNHRHTQFLGDITWADVYDSLKDRICAEGIECEIIFNDYDECFWQCQGCSLYFDVEGGVATREVVVECPECGRSDSFFFEDLKRTPSKLKGKISEIRISFPRTQTFARKGFSFD